MIEREHLTRTWLHDAVVYEVYPRSFKDTDNDGNGDLEGIIEKLDYLNDGTENSLGVDVIWLTPIYASPMVDLGYDISDHYNIDPIFGNLETFDRLVAEVHKRGMKILMDFVPNHTSNKHPWFLESRSSKDDPKRDWYVWHDPKPDGSPPNNWISKFGDSAWTLDKTTGQYYLHKYLPEQPDLNWRNEEVQNEMRNVMRFWLARGVDGFRTDAINQLVEDDQFADDSPNPNYDPGTDGPYQALLHEKTRNRPENLSIVALFCQTLSEFKERYMISEAHVDPQKMIEFYHACPSSLIAPFNFNLINLPWSAEAHKKTVGDIEAALHGKHWPNYVLGNHDVSRLASRIGKDRARLAAMLLFTLRGTPVVYYGEELGMEDISADQLHMSGAQALDGRNRARSPMQWSGGPYASFSEERPWLPLNETYQEVNVSNESDGMASILNLYKTLIHIRKNTPAILRGEYREVATSNEHIFAYERFKDDKKVVIVLNFSEYPEEVNILKGTMKVMCDTTTNRTGDTVDLEHVVLGPHQGIILQ